MFGNRVFRLLARLVLPLATFGAFNTHTMRGDQPYVR